MNEQFKKEIEFGIKELSKEPDSIYKVLNNLFKEIEENNIEAIIKTIWELDYYAWSYLNKEEYYAEITGFPKINLLKKDHDYYRATYYRLRYHVNYYNLDKRESQNVRMFALHLASNLKTWLDFHMNTMDEELIGHMKNFLKENQ